LQKPPGQRSKSGGGEEWEKKVLLEISPYLKTLANHGKPNFVTGRKGKRGGGTQEGGHKKAIVSRKKQPGKMYVGKKKKTGKKTSEGSETVWGSVD